MKNLFKMFGIILITGMVCIGCQSDVPEETQDTDNAAETSTPSTTTTQTKKLNMQNQSIMIVKEI